MVLFPYFIDYSISIYIEMYKRFHKYIGPLIYICYNRVNIRYKCMREDTK